MSFRKKYQPCQIQKYKDSKIQAASKVITGI